MSPSMHRLAGLEVNLVHGSGKSALTVTPWMAAAVPITRNVEGHVSRFATTVVTAVGGSCKAGARGNGGFNLTVLHKTKSAQSGGHQ